MLQDSDCQTYLFIVQQKGSKTTLFWLYLLEIDVARRIRLCNEGSLCSEYMISNIT